MTDRQPVRLGLRANLGQFALLVGVNALVGGMIGQERTVLPLLAVRVFHPHAITAALTPLGEQLRRFKSRPLRRSA